ncbi:unnamed protein product, partial [Ixodes hexagonus]
PQSYSFGYNSADEFGTRIQRQETSDVNNVRTGSYGYADANGIFRHVQYIADAAGFRATVDTNEPGTAGGQSAGVLYNAAPAPQPYTFGYETVDGHGNKQVRHEESDASNFKRGSYGFHDANGIYRHVKYVADDHGFRASIETNEPGTASSYTAGAFYNAHQHPVKTVTQTITPVSHAVKVEHAAPVEHNVVAAHTSSVEYAPPGPQSSVQYGPEPGATLEFVPSAPLLSKRGENEAFRSPALRSYPISHPRWPAFGPITPLIFKYHNQSPEVRKASTEPPSCFQFAAAAARSRRRTVTAGALGGSFPVEPLCYLKCAPRVLSSFAKTALAVPPQPYSFSYDNTDEFGTRTTHSENSDANNARSGNYGYTDATGTYRYVTYVADANGYRATVDTNEPGTKSSEPADVRYDAKTPVVAAAPPAPRPRQVAPPHPYSFNYDSTDETGARISQSESGDESNTKTGSYGYQSPDGVYRTVNYVADANGFRASIDTNEPGTKSEAPADVQINANPIEVKETFVGRAKSR